MAKNALSKTDDKTLGDDTRIVWAPNSNAQYAALSSPVWEIFLEGNRGGGKTDTLIMKFLAQVGQGYGAAWRGLIFRKEYKHLDDVVTKCKKWIPQMFPGARWLSSKSDYKWVFPDGEELLLRTMKNPDDYWNYHGHEYPFIGWEELTNWAGDDCYEVMKSCNRCSTPGIPNYYMSSGNPYGVGHGWVKERFIDIGPPGTVIQDDLGLTRVRIHMELIDNIHLMESDPLYIKRLGSLGNANLKEAWLHGNWDIVVGGFLQGIWDPKRHVVEPFNIPEHWPRWRCMDWGFAKPYAIGWYAKDPDTGITYRYRELYGYGGKANVGTREGPDEVSKLIHEKENKELKAGLEFRKNPADTQIWGNMGIKKAGKEITIAKLFSQNKIRWTPAIKGPGSRKSGAQIVINHLKNDTLKVFNTCKHFIRTVPVLMPDEDDWDDVDTDMEDHAWDELRYSMVSRHRADNPAGNGKKEPLPGTYDHLIKVTGGRKMANPYSLKKGKHR